jgi:myo-inositol-1(or 4)-monophosphatase
LQAHEAYGFPAEQHLLAEAVREAGQFILVRSAKPYATHYKPGTPTPWGMSETSPVTDVDLETDALLKRLLMSARPGYGWLSEESPDDLKRLSHARTFIVDPIDGTRAFLKGKPDFTVVAAIVEAGQPIAAAIFNPMKDEMFVAATGHGATLNGATIHINNAQALEGCRMLGSKEFFSHKGWPLPWPKMELDSCASLAYRLALVACGSFDAHLGLTPKHEWDVAAGALIVRESGGVVSTHTGAPWSFNKRDPSVQSLVCAGPRLHKLILERTKDLPIPKSSATGDANE